MPWPFSSRRIVRVRQHDATDCGAACLAAVAAQYGHRIPVARVRQLASTDQHGTTVLGILEAAHRIGLLARGVRATYEGLIPLPGPAIAHVVRGASHHFLVVHSATRSRVTAMDPSDGRVHRIPRAEFQRQWTGVLVLLAPGEELRGGAGETPGALWRLVQLLRPHRAAMLHALVLAVLHTLAGLSMAVYVQKVVDQVLLGDDLRLLVPLSLGMLALVGLQVYLGALRDLLTLRTGQQIDAVLIRSYYRHLLGLPQRFFDTMRVGEVLSRVGDAVRIRALVTEVSLELAVNALVLLLSLALLVSYQWRLALVAAGLLPAYGLIYAAANRAHRTTERQLMERSADLEAQLVESLGAAGTLRRFDVGAHALLQAEQRLVHLLRAVYRSGLVSIGAGGATVLAAQTATVAILWMGARMVVERTLTPGELISCYALVAYLTGPMGKMVSANRAVQNALIAADRLFEILDLEAEAGGGQPAALPPGDIRCEGVTFRYGARTEVLTGLTLSIARGRVTALVGESGSGKSSLAALLQRLYSPQGGRIRVGDVDLRYLDPAVVRRWIGAVPQTIDLFGGSVLDNVALGETEPDLARVLRLCREVGLADWVASLPDGVHSPIGEKGATLSGGQRQRLALARALYRDPEVLILDEATASLDAAAELLVQQLVQSLRARGRTVLVITHRLGAIRSADRIAVLAGGRVVEEGSHQELLGHDGAYRRLWRSQHPRDPSPASGSCSVEA